MLNKLEHFKITQLESIHRNQLSMTLNRKKGRRKSQMKHIFSFFPTTGMGVEVRDLSAYDLEEDEWSIINYS